MRSGWRGFRLRRGRRRAMAELKPKRGFVWAQGLEEAIRGCHAFTVNLTPTKAATFPVLVIPEPDRDPTPEEIEALARLLCPDAPLSEWKRSLACAWTAWRLGARVPS